MATFNFNIEAAADIPQRACLGADANGKFTDKEIGKLVKMGTAQNYVLCVDGDDIEGHVASLEAVTYNDGFSFGTVYRENRVEVLVDAGQVGQIAVLDEVVAGAQAAIGTASKGIVKSGTGTSKKWRVIRHVTGNGSAGDTVLIEPV